MRKIYKITPSIKVLPAKKRVAAYARVSSGKDTSLHSLSAQISYYSTYIQGHRNWEYAGVYADEAVTGTRDNRTEFQRLMEDCQAGKIDIILTKSISRFARNTLALLETVRELKELNVDVHFEQEKIRSMSGDGELMLTILTSFAQKESRSASENLKWRIRKGFEKGELINFRGYEIKDGKTEINSKEAEIVRMVFNDYIGGMGGSAIARKLTELNVPTIFGGDWSSERVIALIKNEKYAGNALLQKKFVADHLTKKLVQNKGELPMYFAEGTHPAIIDTETFEKAQKVFKKRSGLYSAKSYTRNRYPFTSIIKCCNCGGNYKRKARNEKAAWQCSTYLKQGKSACQAKQIPETILLKVAAEVLGLDEFDEEIFARNIMEIKVPEANKLIFVFADGREVSAKWQGCSCAESWTEEMKQKARERQLKISEGSRE